MDGLCSPYCSDHTGARVYGAVPGEGQGSGVRSWGWASFSLLCSHYPLGGCRVGPEVPFRMPSPACRWPSSWFCHEEAPALRTRCLWTRLCYVCPSQQDGSWHAHPGRLLSPGTGLLAVLPLEPPLAGVRSQLQRVACKLLACRLGVQRGKDTG